MDVIADPTIDSKNIQGKVSLNSGEIERFRVMSGDIFFTRTSETVDEIGISSVVLNPKKNTTFSGFILRGRQKNKKIFEPLSGIFFRTNYIRDQIRKTCTYTTRALTNGSYLGKVLIKIPPMSLQKQIFEKIHDLEKLIIKKNIQYEKYTFILKSITKNLLTKKIN